MMGLNICIVREGQNGERIEHPQWDSLRMGGDRDIPSLLTVNRQFGHPYDFEFWGRPEDPAKMRAELDRLNQGDNSSRWRQLEEILTDPNWWVYVSV